MARSKGGHTPREAAYDIALGYLRLVHTGRMADLDDYATTPSERQRVKDAVAKLHNRLLNDSNLDGIELPVGV